MIKLDVNGGNFEGLPLFVTAWFGLVSYFMTPVRSVIQNRFFARPERPSLHQVEKH